MTKSKHSRLDCHPGCAVEATVSLIDGKWKCVILFQLMSGTLRYNQLAKFLPLVTPRMLTNQLRELEEDGLIIRTVYAEVPPKVEYSLSELGQSMAPVLEALGTWGQQHIGLFRQASVTAVG